MSAAPDLDSRVAKLPRWAQQEIRVLQMRLAEAHRDLDRALRASEPDQPADGPGLYVHPMEHGGGHWRDVRVGPVGLGATWRDSAGEEYRLSQAEHQQAQRGILINTTAARMLIRPISGNVVIVRADPR